MVTASEGTNFPLFLHRNTVMQTPTNFRGYSPMRNILQDLDSFPDDSDTQRKLHKIVKKQMAVSDYKKKNKRSVLTVSHGAGGGADTGLHDGAISILVPAAAAPPSNPGFIREQDLLDKVANNLLQRLYEDIKNRLIEEQINSWEFASGKQDQGVGVKAKEKEGFGGDAQSVKPGEFFSAATKQLPAPLNIVPLVRLKVEPSNNMSKQLVNRIKIVPVGPRGRAPVPDSEGAPTIQLHVDSMNGTNNPRQQKYSVPLSHFDNELVTSLGSSVVNLKLPSRNNYEIENPISGKGMNNLPILNLEIPTGGVAPVSNVDGATGHRWNSPFGTVNRVPTIHINATMANAPAGAGSKHMATPFGGMTRPPFIRFGYSRKHGSQLNAITSPPVLNLQIAAGNNLKGSTNRFSFGPPVIPLNAETLGPSPLDLSQGIDTYPNLGSATVEKPPADPVLGAPLPVANGVDIIQGIPSPDMLPNIILTPESSLPLLNLKLEPAPEVPEPPNTSNTVLGNDLKTALENAHKNALASAYSHAVAKAMGLPQLSDLRNTEPIAIKSDEANHTQGNLNEMVTEKPSEADGKSDHPNIRKTLESILYKSGQGILKFTPEDPAEKNPGNEVKGTDDNPSQKKGMTVMNIVQDNPQADVHGSEFKAAIGNMFGKNGLAVVKITQETENAPTIDFKTAIENMIRKSQVSNNGAILNRIPIRGFRLESANDAHRVEEDLGFNKAKASFGGKAQIIGHFDCGPAPTAKATPATPTTPKNYSKLQSFTGNPAGATRVTNFISITFANVTAPRERKNNLSNLNAYQVAPLKAFKVAPLEAFKISPIKALRLAPPLYATPPAQMSDFDLAINNAINGALANVLNSPKGPANEEQNNEHRKGLPAPVNFLYQPIKHNHVESTMSNDGTKCSEESKCEDVSFGLFGPSKDNIKPESEIAEAILRRLKDFVSSAHKFIPEKDFLFKRKEAKSFREKDNKEYLHRKSSVIIPDQNDLHCYYECEAMPFGCMKLRHKQCPRGQFFSMKHNKCLKMSYWKARRRKKAARGIQKKVDYPDSPEDTEPSNEWMDANGPNQKIPPEFKPKQKPTLRIYHLRVRRNPRHEKKVAGKREVVLNQGKSQGMPAKNPSKGLSKRQGFHKHHPRSFLIRINKKEGKHNRDSISDSDENNSEDDEEGDEEEDDDEDPDESEEEPEDEENGDDGSGKTTEKLSRAESIKEFFKSAKAAVTNRVKFTEPTVATAENANKDGSGVKSGRKSTLTGGKSGASLWKSGSELAGKPKQVLLDASIKVDSAFSSALRSILKSRQREKENVDVGNEGLISDRGSQDQLDPELLRVYQHLIRSDPRVKRHYRGKFAKKGH